MDRLTLRPAKEDDREFLYDLHRQALGEYIVQTWGGWDEDWQQDYFNRKFDPAITQIIQQEGADIGALKLETFETYWFIDYIALLPSAQGKGIGSQIMIDTLRQAEAVELPVRLHVLKVNPARRLYERLGFRVINQSETSYNMQTP